MGEVLPLSVVATDEDGLSTWQVAHLSAGVGHGGIAASFGWPERTPLLATFRIQGHFNVLSHGLPS